MPKYSPLKPKADQVLGAVTSWKNSWLRIKTKGIKKTPTESKILEKGRLVESGLVDLWMKEMGDLAKQENKKRIRKVNFS